MSVSLKKSISFAEAFPVHFCKTTRAWFAPIGGIWTRLPERINTQRLAEAYVQRHASVL